VFPFAVIKVVWKSQALPPIGATDQVHNTRGSVAQHTRIRSTTMYRTPGYFQVQRPSQLLAFLLGIPFKTHLEGKSGGVDPRAIIFFPQGDDMVERVKKP
jgi:hypothetical protein